MHQSGFTPGDSSVHQLVYLYALNDKKDVRIVFCDQSNAFDRVWHQGLLNKLVKMTLRSQLRKLSLLILTSQQLIDSYLAKDLHLF